MGNQTYLNERELAKKWGISHRTLQRWRWLKQGPNYLKIGGRVRYRPEDILKFETRFLYQSENEINQKGEDFSECYDYSVTLNGTEFK